MYLNLEQVKKHLNIDEDFHDDDLYLLDLITVAEDAVSVNTNKPLCKVAIDGVLPAAVVHACLLLIGTLYAHRESVTHSTVNKVAHTYDYLIALYSDYNKCF